MTIVAQASGVGSIALRRAPRPVARSRAAKAAFQPEPVVGVELVEGVDGLPLACVGGVRHRGFEHADEHEHRGREECAAEGDRAVARVIACRVRVGASAQPRRRGAGTRSRGATRRPTIWCWPWLSCQYAKVLAGPVSLLGSVRFRTRPTRNSSPASTPASGRKRSNRLEAISAECCDDQEGGEPEDGNCAEDDRDRRLASSALASRGHAEDDRAEPDERPE